MVPLELEIAAVERVCPDVEESSEAGPDLVLSDHLYEVHQHHLEQLTEAVSSCSCLWVVLKGRRL